ncbi:MAG: T9SS type A sorting domain-containing protein [Bacteroidia bacterium]|nr:T9SS type A sorting domain-containing protein [Bacteroidia bacterium]MCX7652620.1 T9SS type A sorting domain-containing protein [Bacteroidia bacterium]MDW8417027.1 T9SS type A sorting domain-containing protein [Bacteroidia bacterium]
MYRALYTLLGSVLLAQPLSGTYLVNGVNNFSTKEFATLQQAFDSLHNRGAQGGVVIRLVGGSTWSAINEPSTIRLRGYTCTGCQVRVELDTATAIAKSPSNNQTDRFLLRFSGNLKNFTLDGKDKCTLHVQTNSFGTGVIGFVSESGYDLKLDNVKVERLYLRGSSRNGTEVGVFIGRDAALSGPSAVLVPLSSIDTLRLRQLRIWAVSNGIYAAARRGIARKLFIEEDTIGTPMTNPNLLDAQSWGGNLGASGIRIGGFYESHIRRCVVRNAVRNDNTVVLLSGIRTDTCENIRITHNLIHGLRYIGNEGYAHHGIVAHVPTTYNLPDGEYIIANNMIADIYGDGDDDPSFLGSFLRGAYYPSGIVINAFDPVSDARVKIFHNTINLFGQNPSTYPTGGSACITIRPRVSGGVTIQGNILQNTLLCSTSPDKKAYGIAIFHNGATNFNIGPNALYVASNAAGGDFAGLTFQTDHSWNSWQSLGYEAGGKWLSADIPFISDIDLHLASYPPDIVNQGPTPLRVLDDFDGEARPLGGSAPDFGADEVNENSTATGALSRAHPLAKIYPNPTRGKVRYSFPTCAQVALYDLAGSLLWKEILEHEGEISLPFPPGIYLLEARGNGWSQTFRLFIQP